MLGITGEDKYGGRVRPHYHTFENSWLNAISVKIEQCFALKNRADIRAEILAYNATMQAYLDQSNKSAGIIR